MNRIIMAPYKKKACRGARDLASVAGIPCCSVPYLDQLAPADLYINWGYRGWDFNVRGEIINTPEHVNWASHKLNTLRLLQKAGLRVPWFTDSVVEAHNFMKEYDKPIIARTELRGKKGRGIYFIDRFDQLFEAPLYVEYVGKTMEFRIHVFNKVAIDIVRKKRPKEMEIPVVWNYDSGYRFSHNTGLKPSSVEWLAKLGQQATNAIGLDFGAVDIMLGNKHFYILEVNTAPGLNIEQTLIAYASKIKEMKYDKDNLLSRE